MEQDELRVVGVRRFGEGVFELELERAGIAFVPGDCMALYAGDGRVSRPYSIASGTDERVFRFLVRRMEGGAVSPYLASRKAGDRVRVSAPFGWFRPGQKAPAPFAFIATGTGVAPFLSYLRSPHAAKPRVLLYGVRRREDAVDVDFLRGACDMRLAVSREEADGCHHGRVTDLLDALPVGPAAEYYLCGLDAMIDDVTRWLEARGVEIARIHRECFFNASYEA